MRDIRCFNCGKLLLKADGTYHIEIKCNRCKQINTIIDAKKGDEYNG